MPNIVEVIVRAKDDTKAGFAAAENSSTSLKDKLVKIGLIGGLALGAVAIGSIKMASQFQSSMTLLQTQAGVSSGKLDVLKKGVLELAGQIGFSPNSLAESAYHVASNMQSMGATSTTMLKAVKIAAEGAQVGHADLVDVTNALTAAIASGIPGVQNYSKAMGFLNATVGTGDMTMQNLAQAMGTGMLAVVKGYGLNIKDVGAALATFGDNNIRGAQAATYLRMAVQALAVPSRDGKALLEQWGYSTDRFAKDMQHGGLISALDDLQKMFQKNGVTAKQQGEVITTLFGKRAGAGIAVLMGQMDRLKSKYPDLQKGANKFGDAWATTQQTTQFKLHKLQGAFDALAVELGDKLLPGATKVLTWMSNHSGDVTNMAIAFGGLTAALTAYAVAAKVAASSSGKLVLPIALILASLEGLSKIHDKTGKGTLLQPTAGDLGINGRWAKDIEHWLDVAAGKIDTFRRWDESMMERLRHNTSTAFDDMRHETSREWDDMWNNTMGRLERGINDDNKLMENFRHTIAARYDAIRHSISSIWDNTWNAMVTRTRNGISSVMNWIDGIRGKVDSAFQGSLTWLSQRGKWIIQGLMNGLKSAWNVVANFFKGIPHAILNFLEIHSPPQWAIDAGKHIMNGLHLGMKAGGGKLGNFGGLNLGGLLGGVKGAFSGSAAVAQKYASSLLSMYHWSQAQMGPLIELWNQESGWNAYAVNPSSGAYGIPQSLGHGHPYALGDYKNQIIWGLNYIRGRYGSPAAAWAHEVANNWYASGGPASGWVGVGEHGREIIKLPHSSHVFSNPDSERMMAGGGGPRKLHMTIGLGQGYGDGKIMKEIIRQLRIAVYDEGGNVDELLGWRN